MCRHRHRHRPRASGAPPGRAAVGRGDDRGGPLTVPPGSDTLPPAEALARLRLARSDGIGPLTFRRLLERHGTARAALAALPRLASHRGAPVTLLPEAEARREMDALHRMGARLLFAGRPPYPPLLEMQED